MTKSIYVRGKVHLFHIGLRKNVHPFSFHPDPTGGASSPKKVKGASFSIAASCATPFVSKTAVQGGLVFKFHRLLYHYTPGSRVIMKQKTVALPRKSTNSRSKVHLFHSGLGLCPASIDSCDSCMCFVKTAMAGVGARLVGGRADQPCSSERRVFMTHA